MAYKLTSNERPGLAKLAEECGEVVKDACKIIGGCDSPELFKHLQDEMGDVYAALRFVIDNNPDIDAGRIYDRANEKEIRWDAKRSRRLYECGS